MFRRKSHLSTEDKLCMAMEEIGRLRAERDHLREVITAMQANAGSALAAKARTKAVRRHDEMLSTARNIRAALPGRNWRTSL